MKIYKVAGFTLLSLFIIAEIIFNFILPNVIKLDEYKPLITKIIKEQSQLNLDYKNAKIITTPLFSIGVKADDIQVTMPDESVLFKADKIKTRLALPSLFLLTVKIPCLEVTKPFANIEIINNENYKIVNLIQDIINNKKMNNLENPNIDNGGFRFNPECIRIKIPNIKLTEYKILINDLKSNHFLNIHGDELLLGYFNGKKAKIKTIAQLDSDENKNITLNADIITSIPKGEAKLDEEDDIPERIDIPFVNPVNMYRKYDLKADINTKLRIFGDFNKGFNSLGNINIENLSLKLGNSQLPESNIKIKTFGKTINMDTDLNIKTNQGIKLLGKINYSSNPKMDMIIKTDRIYFNDLLLMSKAILDSLAINNELDTMNAGGYFEADTYIKTNFKKLKSNGYVHIKDGKLTIRNLGDIISRCNINLLFDNNMLNMDNSSIYVNNSKVNINGNITKKNIANINISADKISLPKLYLAFLPQEIRTTYNLNSGLLSFNLNINGKLKNPKTTADISLENININDKKRTFNLRNSKTNLKTIIDKKKLSANFENNQLLLEILGTKSKIIMPNINILLKDKYIKISENNILFNNNTIIKYSGIIGDYIKAKDIDINAESSIYTTDLIKFIGKEFDSCFNYNGHIPTELSIQGNSKKLTLKTKATSDANNYFTPISINELHGKNTVTQSIIDIKPNRIKIKDTGIFEKIITKDKKGNEHVHLSDICKMSGTIAGNNINLLKINIPNILTGKIVLFPKSSFKINKSHAFVMGRLSNPRALGNISITDIKIPEIFLSVDKIIAKIKDDTAHFYFDNVLLNKSDLQINGKINLLSMPLELSQLQIKSNVFDVDKVMKVADSAMKYLPKTNNTTSKQHTDASANIPLVINNSNINIANLKTGNIKVSNIKSDISLFKNIFYLNNLTANIFDGKTNGDISVNLLNTLLNIRMKGENINVDKALIDSAGMKNTLSGKCKFNVRLALKGATYAEQINSLKGQVDFSIKDGQFGPFGKLENLILAENIRESEFFKTALGGVMHSLTTIDTTHFTDLSGKLNFENGICHIEEMTSHGKVLALHIFGNFNIIKNYADMKVRAKMTSIINNLLGPIAMINPVNLVNSAASLNFVTAKAFSIFCETVTNDEINKLPSFSNNYVDNSATKFQIVVRGDAAKPLTLVKSFKWLVTQLEFDKANNFVASIPEVQEGSTATTIQELIEENKRLEAEKKTFKYKLKHIFIK